MVFIGLRVVRLDPENPSAASWKQNRIIHFNPDFFKMVDEKEMIFTLDNDMRFRCDEESMGIFLSAVYGDEDRLKN